jgi:WD40 repeat protein
MIAQGGVDNMCKIHKLKSDNSWTYNPVIEIGIESYVSQIKFLDEEKVLVCTGDGNALVYDIETQTKLLTYQHGATDVTR